MKEKKNPLDNLIPANMVPLEVRQERGRKGGIKSGEVRKARKSLREELLILLETNKWQEKISLAMILEAAAGNTKAYEIIRDTIGEKPKEEIEQKQEIKVVMDSKLQEWGK